MSFLKYLEELPDGTSQTARTEDGYPIRGDTAQLLKKDELDELTLGFDAHVQVFATDSPDDMRAYQNIMDRVANGQFVRLSPDREEFIAARGAWLILCRWAEVKGEIPPYLSRRAGGTL